MVLSQHEIFVLILYYYPRHIQISPIFICVSLRETGNISSDENILQATAVTVSNTLDFAFDSEILCITPASMSKRVLYLCTW